MTPAHYCYYYHYCQLAANTQVSKAVPMSFRSLNLTLSLANDLTILSARRSIYGLDRRRSGERADRVDR